MIRLIITILIVCANFGLLCTEVDAAVMSIVGEDTALSVGDTFYVDVILNTEDETINTIDATISYNAALVAFKKFDDADSGVTFWVEKPTMDKTGSLHFSGVIPGGINTSQVPLLRVYFTAERTGQEKLFFSGGSLLLHDGIGTEAAKTLQDLHISITSGTSTLYERPNYDTELPEDFTPVIASDQDVFDGDAFLVFATEDKGSGISYYAVKEGLFDWFRKVESPYQLKHQTLDRKIYIKAVDRSGNERLSILYPQNDEPWHQQKKYIFSILVVCISTLGFLFIFFYRKKH